MVAPPTNPAAASSRRRLKLKSKRLSSDVMTRQLGLRLDRTLAEPGDSSAIHRTGRQAADGPSYGFPAAVSWVRSLP